MLGELLMLQGDPALLAVAILGLLRSEAAAQGSRVGAQGGSPSSASESPRLQLPAEAQPLASLARAAKRVLQSVRPCGGPSYGGASLGSRKRRNADGAMSGKPSPGSGAGAGLVAEVSAGEPRVSRKRRKSAAGGVLPREPAAADAPARQAAGSPGAAHARANMAGGDAGLGSGEQGLGVDVDVQDSARSAVRLRKLLRRVLTAAAPRVGRSGEAAAHADRDEAADPAGGRCTGAAGPASRDLCATSGDGHDVEAAANADGGQKGVDLLAALLRAPADALASELPSAAAACWALDPNPAAGVGLQPCPDLNFDPVVGLHEPGLGAAAARGLPGNSAFAPLFWACRAHGVSPWEPAADPGGCGPDPGRVNALAAALDTCPFLLLLHGVAARPGSKALDTAVRQCLQYPIMDPSLYFPFENILQVFGVAARACDMHALC